MLVCDYEEADLISGLDHIGAVFLPNITLRIIGRLAFPIYCFLLVEGAYHTKDPKKYLCRLSIGALLAELPFDLLFYGNVTLRHQSVMVTLLLGYLSLLLMRKCTSNLRKILSVVSFALLAELIGADYGGLGILMINLFSLTRELPYKEILQTVGLFFICMEISSTSVFIACFHVSIQVFAVLSMVPIALYSGKKVTQSKIAQMAFYLFYPVHLAIFCIL